MELIFTAQRFYFKGKVSELESYLKEMCVRHRTLKEFLNANLHQAHKKDHPRSAADGLFCLLVLLAFSAAYDYGEKTDRFPFLGLIGKVFFVPVNHRDGDLAERQTQMFDDLLQVAAIRAIDHPFFGVAQGISVQLTQKTHFYLQKNTPLVRPCHTFIIPSSKKNIAIFCHLNYTMRQAQGNRTP